MVDEIAGQLAKRFIARKDVIAVQRANGEYAPLQEGPRNNRTYVSWKMKHLREHVAGTQSYGHYLLDTDDTCKLFAYDIDLVEGWQDPNDPKPGVFLPVTIQGVGDGRGKSWTVNPRAAWAAPDTDPLLREALVNQLRGIGEDLAKRITDKLGIEMAVAYSGNKGIHVYGWTGQVKATKARRAAHGILRSYGAEFTPTRGDNFWRHEVLDACSIEVFPKQDSLSGKNLGNLMRLPCGTNLKSGQRGYFMDLTTPWDKLYEADTKTTLENGTKLP